MNYKITNFISTLKRIATLSILLSLSFGGFAQSGSPVTFTVNSSTVPIGSFTKYTTISGTYTTIHGSGTWSFQTVNPGCSGCTVSKFFHTSADASVSTNTGDQKVYFGFTGTSPHSVKGTFTFNGPAIKPVVCGNSGETYGSSWGPTWMPLDYGVAWDNWTCTWSGGGQGTVHDANNQLDKADGALLNSGSPFSIIGIPKINTLSWRYELPSVNSFTITMGGGDIYEGFALMGVVLVDTDNDGIPDDIDIDDDNDGIPDVVENSACGGGPCDTDNDGTPDHLDLDADNDGIPDIVEVGGTDTDGDGRVDDTTDTDGDGLVDALDNNDNNGPTGSSPCSPQPNCLSNNTSLLIDTDANGDNDKDMDMDNDGIPNYLDLDADNDGIPDIVEAGGIDTDGDGRVDNYEDNDDDGFHDLVDGDTNNDGVADNSSNALVITGSDNNGDGAPDNYPNADMDGDGLLNFLDLDADNDGILDVVEVGAPDSNNDGFVDNGNGQQFDTDNDGLIDNVDGDVGNDGIAENSSNAVMLTSTGPNSSPTDYPYNDFDDDNIPNYLDRDADNDGILDDMEAQGNSCYVQPSSSVDANGVPSNMVNYQNCSQSGTGSASNNASDISGTSYGIIPNADNDDGDTTPDYLDVDADGDGIADWIEGFDHVAHLGNADNNALDYYEYVGVFFEIFNAYPGQYDNNVDSDNDGVPDWIDNLPFGGSNIEPSAPALFQTPSSIYFLDSDNDGIIDLFDFDQNGRNQFGAPRPDFNGDGNFDWRDAETATNLPIELLSFTSSLEGQSVLLNWTTASELNNSHFLVQHSSDGINFQTIGQVEGQGTSQTYVDYSFVDETAQLGMNYYRLEQVDFDGNSTFSDIRVEEINQQNNQSINVWPNPTSEQIHISKQIEAYELQIANQWGQTIRTYNFTQEQALDNQQINLEGFAPGMYYFTIYQTHNQQSIQVIINQ